jgi:hypothetical protein
MIMDTNGPIDEFAPPSGVKRWSGKSALELMEEAAAAREDDLNADLGGRNGPESGPDGNH